MPRKRRGPSRDARGRFIKAPIPVPKGLRDLHGRFAKNPFSKPRPRKRPIPANPIRPQHPPNFVRPERTRDAKGRFVSKGSVRLDYVRKIEELRREVEKLKEEKKLRDKDIERNFKRRGGAWDTFVDTLALGQRARIEKWLDAVYDGEISKDDFVILAVSAGLTIREAWAVLYS